MLHLTNDRPVNWACSGDDHAESCRCRGFEGRHYATHLHDNWGRGHIRDCPEVACIWYPCWMRTRSFSPRFYNRQMTFTFWLCMQIHMEWTTREGESLSQKCSAVSMAHSSWSKPNLNRLNYGGWGRGAGDSHTTFSVGLQIFLWLEKNGCSFILSK